MAADAHQAQKMAQTWSGSTMSTEVREWWCAGGSYAFLAWYIRATADALVNIKVKAQWCQRTITVYI